MIVSFRSPSVSAVEGECEVERRPVTAAGQVARIKAAPVPRAREIDVRPRRRRGVARNGAATLTRMPRRWHARRECA